MPIRVTVKLLGILKEEAGWYRKAYVLEDGATVRILLEKLVKEYPGLAKYFNDPEAPITVLVNGRDVEFLDGFETKLHDGDTVALIPPAGGGLKL